jgi:drug/metabolite transporter (DMT)-like permease
MKNILFIALTIIFSGISVFFRKLAVDKIHPYQIQILAGLLYGTLIPMWMFFMTKSSISFNFNILGNLYGVLCLLSYVLSAVILGLLLKTTSSVGTISILVSINPLITLLFSYFFLGEEINMKKIIATILILSGVVLLK